MMISVCMATYNGEKFIEEQLVSILTQLRDDDELIVSDDGSKDRTCDIVKNYPDKRIRLIHNKKYHGYTANFYNALKLAKGDNIFLADQDDVWQENKVKVTMQYLSKYDFTVSDACEVDEKLQIITRSRFEKFNIKNGFWRNLVKSRYIGCCYAFNRKVLDSIFPVPTYQNDYPHDLWIALIAERYFKTSLIKEPLILYRRHGSNTSNGGDENEHKRSVCKKVLSRFRYYHYVNMHRRYIKK